MINNYNANELQCSKYLTNGERIYCRLLFLFSPIALSLNIPFTLAITSLFFVLGAICYYMTDIKFRDITHSWPLKVWLALSGFHVLNAFYNHVPDFDYVDALHTMKIYSCIAIFTYWFSRDFWGTIKELLITFGLYMILAAFVCDFDDDSERLSGVIYATQLGQSVALYILYFALWAYKKNYTIAKTLMVSCIPMSFIMLAQTRNPLFMVFIILMGYIFAHNNKKNIISGTQILKVCLGLVVLALLSYYALKDTSMGQRFVSESVRYSDSYQFQQYSTGTLFDTIVGDRLIYYVVGFSLFLTKPLTGIGLWNYRYVTQGDYPLHSEYMVHLCEGGIIGLTMWFLFLLIVFKRIWSFNLDINIKAMALMGFGAILFCGIYAREFFYEFFYPAYGLFLALHYYNSEVEE